MVAVRIYLMSEVTWLYPISINYCGTILLPVHSKSMSHHYQLSNLVIYMLGLAQLAFWACVSSDSPQGGEGLKPYKEEKL